MIKLHFMFIRGDKNLGWACNRKVYTFRNADPEEELLQAWMQLLAFKDEYKIAYLERDGELVKLPQPDGSTKSSVVNNDMKDFYRWASGDLKGEALINALSPDVPDVYLEHNTYLAMAISEFENAKSHEVAESTKEVALC